MSTENALLFGVFVFFILGFLLLFTTNASADVLYKQTSVDVLETSNGVYQTLGNTASGTLSSLTLFGEANAPLEMYVAITKCSDISYSDCSLVSFSDQVNVASGTLRLVNFYFDNYTFEKDFYYRFDTTVIGGTFRGYGSTENVFPTGEADPTMIDVLDFFFLINGKFFTLTQDSGDLIFINAIQVFFLSVIFFGMIFNIVKFKNA